MDNEGIFNQLVAAGAEYRANVNGWTPVETAAAPGWTKNPAPWSYHEDGQILGWELDILAKPFAEGDTVGCGIDFRVLGQGQSLGCLPSSGIRKKRMRLGRRGRLFSY